MGKHRHRQHAEQHRRPKAARVAPDGRRARRVNGQCQSTVAGDHFW